MAAALGLEEQLTAGPAAGQELVASTHGRGQERAALALERAALLKRSRLPDEARQQLLKRPLGGNPQISPLADCSAACHELSLRQGERRDEDTLRVVREFLGSSQLALASKRLRAESMDISARKLEALTPQVGSAVVLLDRWGRAAVEKAVAQSFPPSDLLVYAEFAAYDKTPLRVTLRGSGVHASRSSGSADHQVATSMPAGMFSLGAGSALASHFASKGAPQKIMQTTLQGGLLVRANGGYVSIFSSAICSLAACSSGHASVIKEVQHRMRGISRAAVRFSHAVRSATTDRYSGNVVSERSIKKDMDELWAAAHFFCDVHRTAGVYTKAFVAAEANTRGMIHAALALGNGAALIRFRRAVREEISSRFCCAAWRATARGHRSRLPSTGNP